MRTFLAVTSIFAVGCAGSPSAPARTGPAPGNPARAVVAITATAPASGATLVLPASYQYNVPGGLIIPRGTGHISADITVSVSENVPWARLNVYLLAAGTNDSHCGQNLPDSPTWVSLERGWNANVRITGFQVWRLPCSVTGFRAVLHTRNSVNGFNNLPITAAETIAEAFVPTSIQLRQ